MEYRHGGDIYTYPGVLDFSSNVNPFGPPPAVIAAVKRSMEKIAQYPDYDCRRLRKAASKRWNLPEEYFLFGNGAAELLYSLIFAEKPRHAVLCIPCFSEYEKALRAVGCRVDFYRLRAENAFLLREDYLELLTEEVDLVILCSPDNPTGRVHDRRLLRRILEKCEELQIRMVVDECFCEFSERPDLMSEVAGNPSLFLLRAFTKIYTMPGLRLGYAICSDQKLYGRIALVRQPWNVSVVAQEAGIAALEEVESDWIEKSRRAITRQRREMQRRFSEMGINVFPSETNYLLFYSDFDLFHPLLKRGILIRDCSDYEGLQKGYFRAAVRTEEENQILLNELEQILKGRKNEWQNQS